MLPCDIAFVTDLPVSWDADLSSAVQAPFTPVDHLIALSVIYDNLGGDEGVEGFILLFQDKTVHAQIGVAKRKRKPRNVRWEKWGAENARLIRVLVGHESSFHGMRALCYTAPVDLNGSLPDQGPLIPVQLYDYAPLAVRKHQTDVAHGRSDSDVILSDACHYGQSKVFHDQDIITRLPALVRHTHLTLAEGLSITQWLNSAYLTEGGIAVEYEVRSRVYLV